MPYQLPSIQGVQVLPPRPIGGTRRRKGPPNDSQVSQSGIGSKSFLPSRDGVKSSGGESTGSFLHPQLAMMPLRRSSVPTPIAKKLHSLQIGDPLTEYGYSYGTGPIVHQKPSGSLTHQPPLRELRFSEPIFSRSTSQRTGRRPSASSITVDRKPCALKRKLKHAGRHVMMVGA